MTKFEQIGVNYQYNAESKKDASKAFQHSCHACCTKGIQISCDKCSIAWVHSLVVATFEEREKKGA